VHPARVPGWGSDRWRAGARVPGRGWVDVAVAIARVLLVVGVAGDQNPGDGTVAGQPLAGLGIQRSGPAGLTPERSRAAEEAVQVHGDGQLRADPTGLGESACFQAAAGQLGQGISAALATAADVLGAGRTSQRFQSRQ
jgi:hypothetical protein